MNSVNTIDLFLFSVYQEIVKLPTLSIEILTTLIQTTGSIQEEVNNQLVICRSQLNRKSGNISLL